MLDLIGKGKMKVSQMVKAPTQSSTKALPPAKALPPIKALPPVKALPALPTTTVNTPPAAGGNSSTSTTNGNAAQGTCTIPADLPKVKAAKNFTELEEQLHTREKHEGYALAFLAAYVKDQLNPPVWKKARESNDIAYDLDQLELQYPQFKNQFTIVRRAYDLSPSFASSSAANDANPPPLYHTVSNHNEDELPPAYA